MNIRLYGAIALGLLMNLHGAMAAEDLSQALVTINPVIIHEPTQNRDVSLRITAPVNGTKLPVILFAHGAQYSKDDYLPLSEFWASHGYVVIQPTHIDSTTIGLQRTDPRMQDAWRGRLLDMHRVLDTLDEIVRDTPLLKGRVDTKRILAAGHSFGGHTAAALVGAKMPDVAADFTDPRITAGVLLAPPSRAPGFRNVEWRTDSKPVLIVAGLEDLTMENDWHAHAQYFYNTEVGNRCLAAMTGVEHFLGGTLGMHRTEEKKESPATLAEIQKLSLQFFDAAVKGSGEWAKTRAELLQTRPSTIGIFACK